ncbi:fumarylacetoacetate hydrolase family protein [Streptomyces sp. NPDC046821]|uniref:2-keto-4-pentenoate hydratase n=1 Tax=Streptomyces sp. NPDC046821 TaxID=3154702 RepID=UPI0033CA69D5
MKKDVILELAQRLRQAGISGEVVDPEAADGLSDLDEAYAVEGATRSLALGAGERLIGYKIGLTSQPARDAFDAKEPAVGHLLAGRQLEEGRPVPVAGLFQPKVEVEIAFILGEALPGPHVTAEDVRRATVAIAPAFEIVGSRWRGGARSLPMLVADNTNAAWISVGARTEALPRDMGSTAATLSVGERTIAGSGTAVMGDPAEAVAWLAGHLLRSGSRLEAGDVVMSGTLCPPTDIKAGDHLVAEVGGLGRIVLDVV